MSPTDKAIAILGATRDGNALSPGHLYLVELAINRHLTSEGEAAFGKLYDEVMAGTYQPPWLYGIQHLRRRHDGCITWKGVVVDHYSFSDAEREQAAAQELAQQCQSLEDRGFPVQGRTVGRLTPFFEAPAGTPWVKAMLASYTIFRKDGRCKELILSLPGHNAVSIAIICGEIVLRYALGDERNFGCYYLFHSLQDEGMTSDCNSLHSYAGFVAAMEEAGITPEAVDRVLAVGLPGAGTA